MVWTKVTAGAGTTDQAVRAESWMAPARGRGGQGVLTSESHAGDRVAALVLLHTGEIAGTHQQAVQHGSGATARRGARAGPERKRESEHRVQTPPELRGSRAKGEL